MENLKLQKGISTRHKPSVRIKNTAAGITLIALVITIIVLLILAGVSISLVVGENGVLTQASTSVVKTREAEAREEVSVAWASMETDYLAEWTKNTSTVKNGAYIKTKLDTYLEGTGEIVGELVYNEETSTYTFTYKPNDDKLSYEITMSTNGKVISVCEGTENNDVDTNEGGTDSLSINLGKYVKYDADGDSSVEDETILWRVLRDDADKVELITADALGPLDITRSDFNDGRTIYNNIVPLMVQKCVELTGISSVRNVGGPATEEEISDANTVDFSQLEVFSPTVSDDDFTQYEGATNGLRKPDNNFEEDWNQMQKAGVTQADNSEWYCLASRQIHESSDSLLFCMGWSIGTRTYGLCRIYYDGATESYRSGNTVYLRPVLTLSAGILEEVSSEAGTKEQPIEILQNN